jgi:hypothetical protein
MTKASHVIMPKLTRLGKENITLSVLKKIVNLNINNKKQDCKTGIVGSTSGRGRGNEGD